MKREKGKGKRENASVWPHAFVVILAVLIVYGADVGRAFVKEDANWIMRSRIDDAADWRRLFIDTGGFFRPVVGLSFAVNYWMFKGWPAGYGWSNLILALGIATALFQFTRVLGLPRGAAVLTAALWILNFHGINMALLWLSGRTALLLTLFAVLAATAAARLRILPMALFALLAMASKEEGVLLPLILLAVVWFRPDGPPVRGQLVRVVAALATVWLVYAAVRTMSDAYTPVSAPAHYTFTVSPAQVVANAGEYADRALTFSAIVTLLALAIARRRVRMHASAWKLVMLSAVWFVVGFGLTVFLPVRSSLYALFPSIGGAIAAAALLTAVWTDLPVRRQQALAVLGLVVPLAIAPIHRQRNVRWTELAAISHETIATFAALAPHAPERWHVIIFDDRTTRSNVASALGWGLTDTVELVTGRRPHVWIVPPPPDIDPSEIVTSPAAASSILELRDGRLVRSSAVEAQPTRAGEYW